VSAAASTAGELQACPSQPAQFVRWLFPGSQDGDVIDLDTPLGEQLLDVAVGQAEAQVPNGPPTGSHQAGSGSRRTRTAGVGQGEGSLSCRQSRCWKTVTANATAPSPLARTQGPQLILDFVSRSVRWAEPAGPRGGRGGVIGYLAGRLRAYATPRPTQRRRSPSSAQPSAATMSQPFIGRPVRSNGRAPGSVSSASC
jgi:hypothetical protein